MINKKSTSKFTFTLIELKGRVKEKYPNLTLAILCQNDNIDWQKILSALRDTQYFSPGEEVYFPEAQFRWSLTSDFDGPLKSDIYSNQYDAKDIQNPIQKLTEGVEIFIVERNLGFDTDLPVFDLDDEDRKSLIEMSQGTNWILASDESVIGKVYPTCPELIAYKQTKGDVKTGVVSTGVCYCKNDTDAINKAILASSYFAQSTLPHKRAQMSANLVTESVAQSALDNLALLFERKALRNKVQPVSADLMSIEESND
ncbi:hypothetical protein F0225_19195 [Vibrio pectenicida]|uniref:Uncharacterized protein n=2 Tax=Vibrio pectenicida TaxID=62763 RepID=A0A7Y4A410_9VIBR|nr:hypothetical protein [Vibrio pectenicida]NOH73439.1 hypothetical protein [Vibrio pectenicida]